ncbi:MAG: hypothetical protein A2Y10_15270 [Planctomycetes bacterium GWF2_41_51]|nr:MAG: hypothetical protein A2Y10_15270 [Planctomycetes bacterium GWF2_41_51]
MVYFFGFLYLLYFACSAFPGSVEIIAHRGASHVAPENTIAAFIQAWKDNSDAAECDVFLTKDKRIVVIHDISTKHVTGIDLRVSDVNSDVIRTLDAGKLKHPDFTGEKIPFLEEVIETVPPGKRLFIEIKCGQEILPFLKEDIEKNNKKPQLTIIGFDLTTITAAKKMMPEIPAYWLVGRKKDPVTEKLLPYDPNIIQIAKDAGIDAINAHSLGMTPQLVEKANAAGLKIYVYTVDDVNEAKYLMNIGVSGITTNKPALLLSAIRPVNVSADVNSFKN